MVDRIALGNLGPFGFGLRIGKIGFPWDTPNFKDLAFTSEAQYSGQVHVTGQLVKGNTVTFPELPFVPIVEAYWIDPLEPAVVKYKRLTFTAPQPGDVVGDQHEVEEPSLTVYKDKLEFLAVAGAPTTPAMTVRYIIYLAPGGE